MGASSVLEFRSVSKRYGAVQALDDVSAGLGRGRVMALCGENGAGKSTLSAIAAGLQQPDTGELRVDGESVSFTSPRDAHDAGVRIVPQELVLCPNLTVAENVSIGELPARRGVLDRRRIRSIAHERLNRLGHALDVTRTVGDLGVVDQACVQIARSLAPGARVLVVDEPTAPMSRAESERLIALVRGLADGGMSIVYVSHRLDEVFEVADDVLVLRDGRVVYSGPCDSLTRSALVSRMVGDRDLTVGHSREVTHGAVALEVRGLGTGQIDDVDLDLHVGEVLAVYGIAGSGREELGHAIVGAGPRRSGSVTTGDDAAVDSLQAAIDAGVGYVPAERRSQGLVLGMSIRDNMTLPILDRLSRGGVVHRRRERALVDRWIGQLAVATPSAHRPVGVLSGGSQQKVLLARWLAAESCVLVLDEPTRGVDVATKAEIYRLLHAVARDGGAVLVISSDLEEVVAIADRVLVMRRGRFVGEFVGATEAAIANAALTPTDDDPSTEDATEQIET